MKKIFRRISLMIYLPLCVGLLINPALPQELRNTEALDRQVRQFLTQHRNQWRDLNIPASDGQILHDIIVENGYTSALEIGTSTGHSAIWIAWALAKTGGKLITIEIDRSRHNEALGHFEEAGLSEYIDARLADAHQLVRELEGPFDFVFSDADKEWYRNYAVDVLPKLEVGGCFTAHNVSQSGRGQSGIREFVDYMTSQDNLETTFGGPTGRSSLSISFKTSE